MEDQDQVVVHLLLVLEALVVTLLTKLLVVLLVLLVVVSEPLEAEDLALVEIQLLVELVELESAGN